MRKILITGGAGYIGHYLIKKLLKDKNNQIIILDNFLYDPNSLDEFVGNHNIKIIHGDICNINDMVKVVKGSDIVVALAAIVGDPACALNEEQTYNSNYHSTNLLVELSNYYKVKRLIFASSCSVYGASDALLNEGSKLNPVSLYAKTRVMSEEVIIKNASPNLEWTILRFATVFGWSRRMRFDLVVNFLTAKAFYTREIDVIGGDQWRPLVHASDVAEALVKVVNANSDIVSKEIFNVGGDNLNFKIKDIASTIKKYIKDTQINEKVMIDDKRNYRVSFEKIYRSLNYRPKHTLDSGINEIITNLKNNEIKNYLDDKYYNVKYLFKHFKK